MSANKPTLHHLNNSQSQRILWLLEELKIPYDLKLYERIKSGPQKHRAPDELKKLNTMGKSPQLVTAEGRLIIESSAIAKYLIETYDTAKTFGGDPATSNDAIRDEELTSFANASLNLILTIEMFLELMVQQSPFFIRPLISTIRKTVRKGFTTDEFEKSFKYLETELGEQDYFMGKNPGRPDFMLSWPYDMIAGWNFVDFDRFPKLKAWRERCKAREAWKESLKKGNGYELIMN